MVSSFTSTFFFLRLLGDRFARELLSSRGIIWLMFTIDVQIIQDNGYCSVFWAGTNDGNITKNGFWTLVPFDVFSILDSANTGEVIITSILNGENVLEVFIKIDNLSISVNPVLFDWVFNIRWPVRESFFQFVWIVPVFGLLDHVFIINFIILENS